MAEAMQVTEHVTLEQADAHAREMYLLGWGDADSTRGTHLHALVAGMCFGAIGGALLVLAWLHF